MKKRPASKPVTAEEVDMSATFSQLTQSGKTGSQTGSYIWTEQTNNQNGKKTKLCICPVINKPVWTRLPPAKNKLSQPLEPSGIQ